ncbi:MAG: hypothetical protein ACSHWU_07815 [Marinicella sp.]
MNNLSKLSLSYDAQHNITKAKIKLLLVMILSLFINLLYADESEEYVVTTIAEARASGDVFVTDNGNIYISDFGVIGTGNGSTVVKITPDGETSIFASGLSGSPSGIIMDSSGDLYVATFNGGDVYRISPNGNKTIINSGLSGPVGLALDNNENLYVAECSANRISKLVNGSAETISTLAGIGCVNGLTWGHDNALYALNFRDGKITRVDLNGNASAFATIPGRGGHLELYGDYYYVLARTAHEVYRVDFNGQVEHFAGTGVDGFDDGPVAEATFSRPNGIGVNRSDGSFVITGSSDPSILQIPIRKISLEAVDNGNDFQINHGLSGAWVDPNQNGQGVVFDFALDENRFDAVMFWFTYDDTEADADTELTGFGSRQNRWFTAIGPVQGSSIMMPIYRSSGGRFDDSTAVETVAVGTVEVEFLSCFEAILIYEFLQPEEKSGTINLQRITPDIMCESLHNNP